MPMRESQGEYPRYEASKKKQAHVGRAELGKAFMQAAFLLMIGVALGVSSQQITGAKIAWVASWSQAEVAARHLKGLQEISLHEAWEAHRAGKIFFLDARDPGSFAAGHLPGALNVPFSEVETYFDEISALEEAGIMSVAYCDGVDCPLSAELARALKDRGIKEVKVLVNGWSRWRDSGYPVEEGEK